MTLTTRAVRLWAPRALGLALCLLPAVLALDAFEAARPFGEAAIDFLIHLAPAGLVLAVVALSWRREWIGGVGFVALAVAYALMADFRLDWVLVISGPLLLLGGLLLWNWRDRSELRTA